MDYTLSRSEQKRRAKAVEDLARELIALKPNEIRDLPCDDFLRTELLAARDLQAGALKRQAKYIAKNLRQEDTEPLFAFLIKRKGSRLKEAKEFQELERLRDDILTDAIHAQEEAMDNNLPMTNEWQSAALEKAVEILGKLNTEEIRTLANRYARTRKPTLRRELFRILQSTRQRQNCAAKPESPDED